MIAAIICAAGSSTRMGGVKKEYRPLPNSSLTVLGAAVSTFAAIPEITAIVIIIPADPVTGKAADEAAARAALPPHLLAPGAASAIQFVPGGASRQASVFNALTWLAASPPDYVLIHDGARPWISPTLIQRVIESAKEYQAAIPLMPLTETPKETDIESDAETGSRPAFIKRHLRRTLIGAAQTPQGFAFNEILAAHQKAAQESAAGIDFTDDAEVWAAYFGPDAAPVAAIPGEIENRKITFPEDLNN